MADDTESPRAWTPAALRDAEHLAGGGETSASWTKGIARSTATVPKCAIEYSMKGEIAGAGVASISASMNWPTRAQ